MNTRETFLEMNGISFRRLLASFAISTVTLAAAMASANADDVFMDVTSITPGSTGGFTGKIGCVEVTGSLAGDDPDTQIADVNFGSSWADSVVDGSAIQFSNPAVYTPSNSMGKDKDTQRSSFILHNSRSFCSTRAFRLVLD